MSILYMQSEKNKKTTTYTQCEKKKSTNIIILDKLIAILYINIKQNLYDIYGTIKIRIHNE